jgi:eukaryotic-like serine/threonine-protein kinase
VQLGNLPQQGKWSTACDESSKPLTPDGLMPSSFQDRRELPDAPFGGTPGAGSGVTAPVPAKNLVPKVVSGLETVVNPEGRPGGGSQGTPTLVRADGSALALPMSDQARMLFPGATDQLAGLGGDLEADPVALGHYKIIGRIRIGGMGAVFRAIDTHLDRVVAIKILPPASACDPQAIARFRHEARSTALLNHDHVARVYFCGEEAGLHYIAFEFVAGTNIRDLLGSGQPLPIAQAVRVTYEIATALRHMAARGVVHRDIKPSNIIVTPEGDATLVDFGLARSDSRSESQADLTVAGTTLGTFDYISPEQARDPRMADVRSDIYSLGCTLYHMLTGEPPYPEGTMLQKLLQHQGDEAPDPVRKNRRVPASLSAVVRAMMAKDVRRRYPGPEPLLRDLALVAASIGLRLGPAGEIAVPADRQSPVKRFLVRHGVWLAGAAALVALVVGVEVASRVDRKLPEVTRIRGTQSRNASPDPRASLTPQEQGSTPVGGVAIDANGSQANDAGQGSEKPVAGVLVDLMTAIGRQFAAQGPGTRQTGVAKTPDRVAGRSERLPSGISPSAVTLPPELVDPKSGPPMNVALRDERLALRPAAVDPSLRLGPEPIDAALSLLLGRRAEQTGAAQADGVGVSAVESGRPSREVTGREVTGREVTGRERGGREREVNVPGSPRPSAEPASASGQEDGGYLLLARESGGMQRFDRLEAACEAADEGSVIELRFNGVRRETPVKIRRRLTLRAARGYRPVIDFQPIQVSGEGWQTRMITIAGGSLEMVGVELVFSARPDALSLGGALVSLERGDSIRLTECTLTLASGDRQFVAAIEVDPGSTRAMADMEMSTAGRRVVPTIELERCLVRGNGSAFSLKGGDPVRLLSRHCIAAVTGAVVRVGIATDLVAEGLQTEVRLEHLSAITGEGLAQVASNLSTRRPLPVQFRVLNSLIANAGSAALINSTGPLPRTDQQSLVTWTGQRNIYSGFTSMWAVGADDPLSMPDLLDYASWRAKWGDAGEMEVHAGPIDWGVRWSEARLPEVTPEEFGLGGTADTNRAIGGSASGENLGADVAGLSQLGLGKAGLVDE